MGQGELRRRPPRKSEYQLERERKLRAKRMKKLAKKLGKQKTDSGHVYTEKERAAFAKKMGTLERKQLKAIRKALINRDGARCAICGLPITKMDDCTVDHIIPKSKGGQTTMENCQLAHKQCNLLKDNYVREEKLDK